MCQWSHTACLQIRHNADTIGYTSADPYAYPQGLDETLAFITQVLPDETRSRAPSLLTHTHTPLNNSQACQPGTSNT